MFVTPPLATELRGFAGCRGNSGEVGTELVAVQARLLLAGGGTPGHEPPTTEQDRDRRGPRAHPDRSR